MVHAVYGWKIERHVVNAETGASHWREDSPAYPANLLHGLQMIQERILTDGPDVDISELPDAIRDAQAALLDNISTVEALSVEVG
jgi:hypothetical protein